MLVTQSHELQSIRSRILPLICVGWSINWVSELSKNLNCLLQSMLWSFTVPKYLTLCHWHFYALLGFFMILLQGLLLPFKMISLEWGTGTLSCGF